MIICGIFLKSPRGNRREKEGGRKKLSSRDSTLLRRDSSSFYCILDVKAVSRLLLLITPSGFFVMLCNDNASIWYHRYSARTSEGNRNVAKNKINETREGYSRNNAQLFLLSRVIVTSTNSGCVLIKYKDLIIYEISRISHRLSIFLHFLNPIFFFAANFSRCLHKK